MGKSFKLVFLANAVAVLATAVPVRWTLQNVRFADGGTASGFFVYDADINSKLVTDWDITTSGGNTNIFSPFEFTPTNSFAFYDGTSGQIHFASLYLPMVLYFGLEPASPLTNAGGLISISLTSSYTFECSFPGCNPYRDLVSGALSTNNSPAGPQPQAVVNAASFLPGSIAPGEIITIFGSAMGPPQLAGLQLTASGLVSTAVADVRVLFDGVPAPLVYAAANQISAVVPYGVGGQVSTQMQVEHLGILSNLVSLSVGPSTPGIFSYNSSGAGQGLVANQDGKLNSPSAPAFPGDVIVFYETGEGQTTPAGVDGEPASGSILPRPVLPVSVTIDGQTAQVLYAGAAPGAVAGLMQVNVQIPAGTSPGTVPLVITVGTTASQPGLNLAIGSAPSVVSQVLIVPGILGTKLASSDTVVWLSNYSLETSLTNPQMALGDLEYDSNGNPITPLTTYTMTPGANYGGLFNLSENPNDSHYALNCNTLLVAAQQLLEGWGGCQSSLYLYNTLVTDLQAAGYSTQTFPYDWRMEIGELSEQLYSAVQPLIQSGNKLAIVAHSMGGLLVGEMLRRHPQVVGALGPIITLGTPYLGSLETYMYFQAWDTLLPTITAQDTQTIGSNWTSAYELLPRWNFVNLSNEAIVPYQQIYGGPEPSHSFAPLPRANNALPVAYSLWGASASFSEALDQAYGFVGTGNLTAVEIDDGGAQGCLEAGRSDGDGTVPLQSATGSSWIKRQNLRYVQETHKGLPSNGAVIGAILRLLKGLPDQLSTVPVNSPTPNPTDCLPLP